jgi:hypothetical protein
VKLRNIAPPAWLIEGVFARRCDDGATGRERCRRTGTAPFQDRGRKRPRLAGRLRAGLVTPLPGGPGPRSGDTTVAPQGARWTGNGQNGCRTAKASPAHKGATPRPPDRSINQETRPRACVFGESQRCETAMERREAPASSKEGAERRIRTRLIGAPSPRLVRGADEGPREAGQGLRPTRGRQKYGR